MHRIVPALALALFASSAIAQNAPFCVVSASGRDCFYYDAPTCQQRAADVRGACVVNGAANNQGNQGGSDWFNNAARGYEAGRRQREDNATESTVESGSNLRPIIEQFCRELQQQDLAELDAIPVGTDQANQEYARRIDIYQARSQRCFAMARAAR